MSPPKGAARPPSPTKNRAAKAVARLRSLVNSGELDRVLVIATMTLAAEAASIGRRSAQAVIITELARGAE